MVEGARPLRLHDLWRALGFGLIVAILALSLVPLPVDPELPENSDKLGHLLAYGSLMFWFAMLYPDRRRQLALAAAFCGMGAGVELLQGMTAYRSFEWADMAANGMGVIMGWGVALTPLKNSLACFEKLVWRNGEI